MTGARVAAGVFVVIGLASTTLALGSLAGGRSRRFYHQLWARGAWNYGPNATLAMAPIGIGIALFGVELLTGLGGLILASFIAMAVGALIYVTDPLWLGPRWTRPK